MTSNFSKKNKYLSKTAIDYWKTFFITLLIVIVFGIMNVLYMIYSILYAPIDEPKKFVVDSAFESYLVGVMIEKNVELLKRNPKNYALNMRLGILHTYNNDYFSAEKEFKNAMEKAASYNYAPNYLLAKLYIKMDKLREAQEIMDKIGEKPNKKLIKYKGNIYSMLAEAYFNQGYYYLAVQKYEKAIYYYSLIKHKKIKALQRAYMEACVALADKYVEMGQIDDAIKSLEKAYEIFPKNVLLNYKLGLLHIEDEPYKAYNFLLFVHKHDPFMMNYDMFNSLILRLADMEEAAGNSTDASLYRKRAKQYQKFVRNNLIYENDLFIEVSKFDVNVDLGAKEYIMKLQFWLQNNSPMDIDTLFIKVVFKDGDQVIQSYDQKLYDAPRVFKSGTMTPPIVLSASSSYDKKNKNRIKSKSDKFTVEVFAYKYPQYAIKLYSNEILKPEIKP